MMRALVSFVGLVILSSCNAAVWPGDDAVSTVDQTDYYPENFSGLFYEKSSTGKATLWYITDELINLLAQHVF